MASAMTTSTTGKGGSSCSMVRRPYAIGSYLSLEPGTCSCQGIRGDFFIHVYCLRMLSQIIQPRKASGAMTLERSFSSMFPVQRKLADISG